VTSAPVAATTAARCRASRGPSGPPPGLRTAGAVRLHGAATSVLLAASPTVAGVTGRYFDDATAVEAGPSLAPYAIDAETASRLWAVTMQLLA
jgi:hypothetical protein